MMKLKTKKEEYNHFDKLANEWWDEHGKFSILHQIRPIRMKYILNQINRKNIKNVNILDVGCGGGLISEPLAHLGANVTGIDFVKQNIVFAKKHSLKRNLKINYICTDIEKLNLNEKFDVIVMLEILEHLQDWKKFLINIKKNLKKNGKIIISTINRNLVSKYLAIHFAEKILKWIPLGTHEYEKFIKPEEIKNLALTNKLSFDNLIGLKYNPITNSWRLSKKTNVNYFCSLTKIN